MHHSTLRLALAALFSISLVACGGSNKSSSTTPSASSSTPTGSTEAGAPAMTGNAATDGRAWINYRRGQLGVAALADNVLVDQAAQAHSSYQSQNGSVTHDETPGKPGFTGATLLDRLHAAGYNFGGGSYAYGEVIAGSAAGDASVAVDDLITAIYHRFVIFEPRFKEFGAGFVKGSGSYGYFTTDFTANNGYGAGLGVGAVAVWPTDNMSNVRTSFMSDQESPDPVPNANEVGYPISVQADLGSVVGVTSFTVQPKGGSALPVRLLTHDTDGETPTAAAAIIPLSVLQSKTTYQVSFRGSVNGLAVSRDWSFTTQ